MKKAYLKPKAKKVSFQYNKVVATSGPCTQGWTLLTTLDSTIDPVTCPKCTDDVIWIGHNSL